jgi:hypothetical protein
MQSTELAWHAEDFQSNGRVARGPDRSKEVGTPVEVSIRVPEQRLRLEDKEEVCLEITSAAAE